MELGFMGLGQMGKPIALNLLKGGGGADLVVLARRDEHLASSAPGARAVSRNPGDLAGAYTLFLACRTGRRCATRCSAEPPRWRTSSGAAAPSAPT